MHIVSTLAAAALAGVALVGPTPTPAPPAPAADTLYTAIDDYVRSLVYWHNHPDWGIPPLPRPPAPPA